MSDPRQYGFYEKLRASQSESSNGDIRTILIDNIPSAVNAMLAHKANDKSGVDWWVECVGARFVAVDCKVREQDWSIKRPPKDDIALETWSVVENEIEGWTRNRAKRADWILWLWKDTGRWMLVPFQMLCYIFNKRWREWADQFGTARQFTPSDHGMNGYHSECVFVPRRLLWKEIYKHYSGVPK